MDAHFFNYDTKEHIKCDVEFAQKEGGFEPVVSSVVLTFNDGEITIKPTTSPHSGISLEVCNEQKNIYQIACTHDAISSLPPVAIISTLLAVRINGSPETKLDALEKYLGRTDAGGFKRLPSQAYYMDTYSTAPVRSQPERTYNFTRTLGDPEGSNLPMQLAQMFVNRKDEWKKLHAQLVEFGESSQLFDDLQIKPLKTDMSVFQLQVKVRGRDTNLIDVGYGVSQILPVLVSVLAPSDFSDMDELQRKVYDKINAYVRLLHEPEIHLHPRAQAEFASLLTELVQQGQRLFIVETHGDYMIDRVRIEIKKGKLKPDDVSLIYFEPHNGTTQIHNIAFDAMGNMQGEPQHYGEFFLKESSQMMGFDD